MTERQRLELRAGEIRQRLAELGGLAEQTDETRGEIAGLRTEYQNVELRASALLIADDKPEVVQTANADDGEARELRAMVDNANLGAIFDAIFDQRMPDGREAELQKHYGVAGNQVPLALIMGVPPELRAVTPAPSNVGQNQGEIIPAVFPQSVAAFLGVDMPTVGVGEAVYPVLTTSATVHTPAENAAAAETTGAFSSDVLSPRRLQASFFYSREDRARFAGMGEALRQNLNEALGDAVDAQILAGTDGLLTGTNLPNNNVNAVSSYQNYKDQFAYGRIDGTFASMVSEVRSVVGAATYAHAAGIYRDTMTDVDVLSVLMAQTGGVRVSAHVPAVASNKQNAVVRRGMRRDMVAPVWDGVSLIPDEVTLAGTGQIKITAVMLHAVKILRADGFHKQQTQHA